MTFTVKPSISIITGLLLLNIILGISVVYHLWNTSSTNTSTAANQPAPEIQTILSSDDLQAQSTAYDNLLDRVGLERGQEMLYQSGLPFNGQTHLLNHTAGEFAYREHGTKAIAHCKDYFLGSCYHGALIAIVANEGLAALGDVMDRCRDAGGGPLAGQCAHAIGHGLLAWYGYANMPKALQQCETLNTSRDNFPAFNCRDGVFMENLWAVHGGGSSPDQWIRDSDLTYPCSDPRLKDRWLDGCWSNQPAVIYRQTKGDLAAAADVCAQRKNDRFKQICFDGLARQIHPIVGEKPNQVIDICRRIMPEGWQDSCILSIVRSDFSTGGRELPFAICGNTRDSLADECRQSVIHLLNVYHDAATARDMCSRFQHQSGKRLCRETFPAPNQ